MSRKVYLADYFSSEQLKEKYFSRQDSVESRRWHLLWKISCGWTLKNSALAVGMSYSYAKQIIKKYNHEGENALLNGRKKRTKYSGGKKSLLTDRQFQKLIEQLEFKPPDGGIWMGPKVARWIEKETRKQKVWNQRGWDYLKKCKYSWQSPRPKAIVNHRYEWLYVYAFVKPKTGETLWYLIPRVNTLWLNLVYKTFAIEANIEEKKVLLVEDNAGWHTRIFPEKKVPIM